MLFISSVFRVLLFSDPNADPNDEYNLTLCQTKDFNYMGTAQIIMPENYIAMFDAPQAEEARQIVARSELDIDRAITSMTDS